MSIAANRRPFGIQRQLFLGAIEQLAAIGEPVNQVLEVDLDGEDVTFTLYDLPADLS